MTEKQTSLVHAEFVVKGDAVSKGGTVFVYDVIEPPVTKDGITTLTICEQVKHRPIVAKWKISADRMVHVHNRTPEPKGTSKRRKRPDEVVKEIGEKVTPPKPANLMENLAKSIESVSLDTASKPIPTIVGIDPTKIKKKDR